MSTFMEVYGWYVNLEKQLAKGKETPGGTSNESTARPSATPVVLNR
jgi:hypothetical protein